MEKEFTVSLSNIIRELSLETLYMPENPEQILISRSDVNRPGLQLSGFFDYFDKDRIQIFGLTEITFLQRFIPEKRRVAISRLFERRPPAMVLARNLDVFPEMLDSAPPSRPPAFCPA